MPRQPRDSFELETLCVDRVLAFAPRLLRLLLEDARHNSIYMYL